MEQKEKKISFRISETEFTKFEKYCKQNNTSVSSAIRNFIEDATNNTKEQDWAIEKLKLELEIQKLRYELEAEKLKFERAQFKESSQVFADLKSHANEKEPQEKLQTSCKLAEKISTL